MSRKLNPAQRAVAQARRRAKDAERRRAARLAREEAEREATERAIAELVASAPPMTPAQIAIISRVFRYGPPPET
jgi:hypothetical protein